MVMEPLTHLFQMLSRAVGKKVGREKNIKEKTQPLQASFPETDKLIMLVNYIVRSPLLSWIHDNIIIHEILFGSCQSILSTGSSIHDS